MVALHRLQWIDAEIRAGRYPNARRLAGRFEISHRQAQRDFEYLRDSLGAPLVYVARRRGYAYGAEAAPLPGPYLTPAERSLLDHLAAYYAGAAARAGAPDAPRAALREMGALFARLSGRTPTEAPSLPAPPVPERHPVRRLPFRAILEPATPAGEAVPPPLAPYHRGPAGPDGILCEFDDAGELLRAVLGTGRAYRIVWPGWLRDRLLAHLGRLQVLHGVTLGDVPPPPSSGYGRSRPDASAGDGQSTTGTRTPSPRSTRSSTMSSTATGRVTVSARLQPNWMTFAGALQGVLEGGGLAPPELDAAQVMGRSGLAFHLIMHETCCPSAATVYDWRSEHETALERLGVFGEVFHAMPHQVIYDAARRRAVTHLRAALDRGTGAVLWGVDVPEFGVVYGYDDADGVFLVDGIARHNAGASDPMLYENVGRSSDVPILHYLIPIEGVSVDPAWAHRAALESYVEQMERRAHVAPGYHSGLLAYDAWLRALEGGTYEAFGLRYNTAVIADAKGAAATYAEQLAASWKGLPHLDAIAAGMRETAGVFAGMLEALEMSGEGAEARLQDPVSPAQARRLATLLRDARAADARTLDQVRRSLGAAPPSARS